MAGEKLTPMMKQYQQIKREMPADVILFFRLGDFYEMFFDDAKRAAPVLDIALTRRNNIPMCGVPYHAVEGYLSRMMRAGLKVAICEQVEDPANAKGIVERAVTQIVTPGTITEGGMLESNQFHYLAGVCATEDGYALSMVDLSTGHFWAERVPDEQTLCDELARYAPNEIIFPESETGSAMMVAIGRMAKGIPITPCDDWAFGYDAAHEYLTRHFGVQSLEGFGCEGDVPVVSCAGGVLHYLDVDLRRQVAHIGSLQTRHPGAFLIIDEAGCANLDLVPMKGRTKGQTLLDVLDTTRTPMGGRMLREWILRPLAALDPIIERHEAVDSLCRDRALLYEVRETFAPVRDLSRLIAKTGNRGGNARDLAAIGTSLKALPAIQGLIADTGISLFESLAGEMTLMPDLVERIEASIVDEPPVAIKEGGMIREGCDATLDELREAATQGRDWLAQYQAQEQERTGIKTLKVRHNKVFGFYIEVSKTQLANVPPEYTRKQTLVNAERFVTPELKTYETRIMGAQDKAMALEYELFCDLRDAVADRMAIIQKTADALAALDVIAALADRALALGYIRPEMVEAPVMHIEQGRHPVVEQMSDGERFVPNDTQLDCVKNQLLLITGPNMAGKSTYIRQVAVLVVMAQLGSFVPAASARIGWVDRIFTRVGASDDLARGRSTFMVEMEETANILNNATPRSLIVLDEIGRGTSTFDGISIAWAVAEHLHRDPHVKARTLFATHYHELTELALTLDGVKNYNVLVKERDDHIVFLRRIVPGSADKSYGIQVARLAGMPASVVERASDILKNLEEGEMSEEGKPRLARQRKRTVKRAAESQMELFAGEAD